MRANVGLLRVDVIKDTLEIKTDKPQGTLNFPLPITGTRDPIVVLKQVFPSIRKGQKSDFISYQSMFDFVSGGGDLSSRGASIYLLAALQANNIPARLVTLRKSLMTSSNYTVVEAKGLSGRWIMLDPYLGGVVKIETDDLVDVQQIVKSIYSGNINAIHYLDLEGVNSKRDGSLLKLSRIGNQSLHKFHYPLIYDRLFIPWFGKIPVLRYWIGPRVFVDQKMLDHHNEDLYLHQNLYVFFTLALPIALLVIGGFLIISLIGSKFKTLRR
jgi:hypothetical protein